MEKGIRIIRMMLVLSVALLVGAGMVFGQSDQGRSDKENPIKVNLKKFQKVKEFTVEVDSARSIAKFLAAHDPEFYFVDSALRDKNFQKNEAVHGKRTLVIYKVKRFVKSREVIAFAEKKKLSFLDPQAFLDAVWSQKVMNNLKIPNGKGIIALNYQKNLFKGTEKMFLFFKADYWLVPYIAKSWDEYRLGVGSFAFGCGRNCYLVFYKDQSPDSQRLTFNAVNH